MAHGPTWLLALLVALAAAGQPGCGRQVLVAGERRAPDAAGPGASDAGAGAPAAPRCSGTLFANNALPAVQMADQPGRSVAGDWNADGITDLAMVNASLNSVSVVLGKGAGTFLPRTDYATGAGPVNIAAGDLNGDHVLDLVIVNHDAASATVLLGKGKGTFGSRTDYATGPVPQALALGDWTSDGRLDLIAGDTLFVGKGDGTFAHGVTYGYDPIGLVTGDLDHDGHLDLVLTADSADVYVLLGKGDGTFARKRDLHLEQSGEVQPLPMLADLDGDGTLDLVIDSGCPGEASPHVYTFLGAGDGSFRSETEYNNPACGGWSAIADVNGDGKADVEFDGQITWLGNGDGTFQPYPWLTSSMADADTMLSLADWNGDGKLDLAMLDRELELKVLPGRGNGTFGLLPFYDTLDAVFGVMDGTLIDLDGDGKTDLLTGPSGTGGVEVRRGNGDGTFGNPVSYSTDARLPLAVRVSDLNGDGKPDLVAMTYKDDVLTVMLGTGQGGFVPTLDADIPSTPLTFAIGDVNGDGIPDLVSVNDSTDFMSMPATATTGSVSVLLGAGDGTFGYHIDTPIGTYPPDDLVLADLDGDHRLDIGLGNQLLFGNGDGTFARRTGSPTLGLVFAAADLNHDGNIDLLGQNSSGTLGVWLGTGAGNFASPLEYPVRLSIPLIPSYPEYRVTPVLADFDGDGAIDLAVATDQITILHGAGDGTFACIENDERDFSPTSLFAGDADHDGRDDLVAAAGASVMVLVSH